MTIRRLLTSAATLALAVTGVALPSASAWEASTVQASAVVASTETSPAGTATTGRATRASVSVPAPTRRRFRSRRTSHDRLPSLSPWSFSL